jgi:hypothetical protein
MLTGILILIADSWAHRLMRQTDRDPNSRFANARCQTGRRAGQPLRCFCCSTMTVTSCCTSGDTRGYLPARRLAIEYQGTQHFQPIEAWGGRAALAKTQARDRRKRELCTQHDVTLIEFTHEEQLTERLVRRRLGKRG